MDKRLLLSRTEELVYRDRIDDKTYLIKGDTVVKQGIVSSAVFTGNSYDIVAHTCQPVKVTADSDLSDTFQIGYFAQMILNILDRHIPILVGKS